MHVEQVQLKIFVRAVFYLRLCAPRAARRLRADARVLWADALRIERRARGDLRIEQRSLKLGDSEAAAAVSLRE